MKGKEKIFLVMFIFVAMVLLVFYPIKDGKYVFTSQEVYSYELNNTSQILIFGEKEMGFGISSKGDLIAQTEDNLTIYISEQDGNVIIDPLLFDVEFLKKQGYNSSILPVVIFMDCSGGSSGIGVQQATSSNTIFAEVKNELSNYVSTIKSDIVMFCAVAADLNKSNITTIASLNFVKGVYLDAKYYYNLNESVPRIYADEVWNLTDINNKPINGSGITTAILDTGIDFNHPDFYGKNITWKSFIIFSDTEDFNGHGTHCASIASGTGNASNRTFTGVAPGADLAIGVVLYSQGFGYLSQILNGIEWVIDPNGDGNYSDHFDVLSMSLGISWNGDGTDPLSEAVDFAVENGVVVVVAAGNVGQEGMFTVGMPAVAKKVITVGAFDKYTNETASFSSAGPTRDSRLKPDVIAPGVDICAANSSNGWLGLRYGKSCGNEYYMAISGTSMATPHVAGAAALLLQAHPDWTPEIIKSVFISTAEDISGSVYKKGAGLINVQKAIDAEFYTNPPTLDFGILTNEDNKSINLKITNLEDYELSLNLTPDMIVGDFGDNYTDAIELNITNVMLLPGQSSIVKITLNANDSMRGLYSGKLLIESNNSSYSLPISFLRYAKLTVGVADGDKLLKPIAIILYNTSNYSNRQMVLNYPLFGLEFGYNYTFILPEGKYNFIVVGSVGDEAKEYNYIFGENVSLNYGDAVTRVFNIEEEPVVYYPNKSFDNTILKLEQLQFILRCNFDGEFYRLQYFMLNEFQNSTGRFFTSPKVCSGGEIYLQFYGTPTLRNGLMTLQDEYYFGGWRIANPGQKTYLSLEPVSLIKIYYDIPGYFNYSDFTYLYWFYPVRHFSATNFWLSPIWFSEFGIWRKIQVPLERTLYLVGDNWKLRPMTTINYFPKLSYTQFEWTRPTDILINSTPKNLSFHLGKSPYLPASFKNSKEGNALYLKTTGPLVNGIDNSYIYRNQGYFTTPLPKVFIYHNGALLFNYTKHNYWSSFSYLTYDLTGEYIVNFTIPLRYPIQKNIIITQRISLDNIDINPPILKELNYTPAFRLNNTLNVSLVFEDENNISSVVVESRFKNENWTMLNISQFGNKYSFEIPIVMEKPIDLRINATDEYGNWIFYEITNAAIPYISTNLNISADKVEYYPGDVVRFNGSLFVNESDAFGFVIKYKVDGGDKKVLYTTFDKWNKFKSNFTIPQDIIKNYTMLDIIFEGSGAYSPVNLSKRITVRIPFNITTQKQEYKVLFNDNFDIVFTIKNLFNYTDEYSMSYTTNLKNALINLDKAFNLSAFENKTIMAHVELTNAELGIYTFNISISEKNITYSRNITYTILISKPSSGGGGGTGGGGAVLTVVEEEPIISIENVLPEEVYEFEKSFDFAIAAIKFKSEIKKGGIEITKNVEPPLKLDNAYTYFEIKTYNLSEEDVEYATILFNVSKQWLKENGLDKNEIGLFRLINNNWEEQYTELVNEDEDYVYYSAKVEGFSYFAISTKKETSPFYLILEHIEKYYAGKISFWEVLKLISNYYFM